MIKNSINSIEKSIAIHYSLVANRVYLALYEYKKNKVLDEKTKKILKDGNNIIQEVLDFSKYVEGHGSLSFNMVPYKERLFSVGNVLSAAQKLKTLANKDESVNKLFEKYQSCLNVIINIGSVTDNHTIDELLDLFELLGKIYQDDLIKEDFYDINDALIGA